MIAFCVNSFWIPFVLLMEEVMKPHSLANTNRVRYQSVCIWLPTAPKKRPSSSSRNLTAHRSQETPVQADTRWAQNQESMASCRSEETAEQVAARRETDEGLYKETVVPGGQGTKSEQQIAEQVSVLFLLKLKSVILALSILGQMFSWSREHMEANGGSTLLLRLVFRRTRDQKCMATHCSKELQRTRAGIGC